MYAHFSPGTQWPHRPAAIFDGAKRLRALGGDDGPFRKFSNFIADKYGFGHECVWSCILKDVFKDLSDEQLTQQLAKEFQEFTDAEFVDA